MSKVRAVLVGVGDWGERHLRALKSLENVELAAICDSNSSRVFEVGKRYNVPRNYTDFRQMLDEEKPDMVDVCTPEHLHKQPVIDAAERGVHVLVEKPIATSLPDADEMISVTSKKGVLFMVGHILRWDARYAMVKEMIEKGEMGRIGAILARRLNKRADGARLLSRVTILSQLAIHDIDLILWYTNSAVKECYARAVNLAGFANPDITICSLSMENGTQAVMHHSFSLPDSVPFWIGARTEIIGSKSFAVVDATEQSLFIGDSQGWKTPDTTLFPTVRGNMTGTLKDEIAYFVSCVQNGRAPDVITPEEAKKALQVAAACQESIATGRVTTVS